MNHEQREALKRLSKRYGVDFKEKYFTPVFDLPDGWVAGWIGGPARKLYVGVDPNGGINS